MPGLSCRFYQHKFPEVEDVVMVNVRSIAEMGAYVSLLEYNNIEGMILLSELSRRRIRSINKLIRIGRNECVVVIRVDKEKGELSLKIIKCQFEFCHQGTEIPYVIYGFSTCSRQSHQIVPNISCCYALYTITYHSEVPLVICSGFEGHEGEGSTAMNNQEKYLGQMKSHLYNCFQLGFGIII